MRNFTVHCIPCTPASTKYTHAPSTPMRNFTVQLSKYSEYTLYSLIRGESNTVVPDFTYSVYGSSSNFTFSVYGSSCNFTFSVYGSSCNFTFSVFGSSCNFTFSVYGSSCHFLFLSLILAPLLPLERQDEMPRIRRRKLRRENMVKQVQLPCDRKQTTGNQSRQ